MVSREGVVVALDQIDGEPRGLEDRGHLADGPRVGEARDAPDEPGQLGIEPVGLEPHVGDADAAAGPHGAEQLGRRRGLVGEGAERALAHRGVERRVVDGEPLGVADVEAGAVTEPDGRGPRPRRLHLGVAEVDPEHLDRVRLGEQHRGGAHPRRDVEDPFTGPQRQGVGEATRQGEPARVVALPQEQRDQIDAVGRGAARLDRLRVRGVAGAELLDEHPQIGQRRQGRAHRSVRPMFTRVRATGAPASGSVVLEPCRVGRSIGASSTAFGTTPATGTPESCSRTCSR